MKCSRCGAEMKIKNVKVDTDIYGNPIYNKYAYCYNCKIKRNLGQQKTMAKRPNRSSSHRAKKQRKTKLLIAILLIVLLLIGICAFSLSDIPIRNRLRMKMQSTQWSVKIKFHMMLWNNWKQV